MNLFREIDKEKYTDKDMPKYPARSLAFHCVFRGIMAGATVGLLSSPIYAKIAKRPVLQVWLMTMPVFSAAGGLILGLYVAAEHWGDVDGVDDRAYRLEHNKGQNVLDNYAGAGAGVGAIVGSIFGRGDHRYMLSTAYSAMMVGSLVYVVQNAIEKHKPQL